MTTRSPPRNQPPLRPADHPEEFVSQWKSVSRNLAEIDALRLLLSFSRSCHPRLRKENTDAESPIRPRRGDDHMLHARVQGLKLGTFDLYFDSLATEQIWAGATEDGRKATTITTCGLHSRPPSRVGVRVLYRKSW